MSGSQGCEVGQVLCNTQVAGRGECSAAGLGAEVSRTTLASRPWWGTPTPWGLGAFFVLLEELFAGSKRAP